MNKTLIFIFLFFFGATSEMLSNTVTLASFAGTVVFFLTIFFAMMKR